MALKCEICRKKREIGHNVSYSKRRTERVFMPNLRMATIKIDGKAVKVKICMKCLKKAKNDGRVLMGRAPFNNLKPLVKEQEIINEVKPVEEIKETKVKTPRKTKKKSETKK